MNIYYFTVGVIVLVYIASKVHQEYLKRKANSVFNEYVEYLDEYQFNLLQDFDLYLKNLEVIKFNGEKKFYTKDESFKNAEILSSFHKIKNVIIKKIKDELFKPENEISVKKLKLLKSSFQNTTDHQKLLYVNKDIEVASIDIVIENMHANLGENKNIGKAAEFIALRAFNIETNLGFLYPDENYNLMYRLINQRQGNKELSASEFWESIY